MKRSPRGKGPIIRILPNQPHAFLNTGTDKFTAVAFW